MLAEEDMTIARWGLAATMVVGFLLASAFLCWLHERDIHPFVVTDRTDRISEFARHGFASESKILI